MASSGSKHKHKNVQDLHDFKALVSERWVVSLVLTVMLFVTYFGFILVLAFDKSIFAAKIGEHVTLGIPVGVGVIVSAWVLTGIYVYWANSRYDTTVKRIREQMGV
jgi:uncharacterized membrane protein (DUF485 family)